MRTLFFSPYSAIWVAAMPESLIARELLNAGHEIHMMRCDTTLRKYCPAMTCHGLEFNSSEKQKSNICASCIQARDVMDHQLNLSRSVFRDYLTDADLKEIDKIIECVNFENWEQISINGIEIGKYATYEVFLNHKISSRSEIALVWDEYLNNLKQCAIANLAVSKFLKTHAIDRIVVYNSLYSLNRTVVKTGESFGVESRTIHGGRNIADMHQTITINKSDSDDFLIAKSDLWNTYKSVPLREEEIDYVSEHIRYSFSAQSPFTYSSKKKNLMPDELREKLNIKASRKVILCTLSSEDERFSADMVGALNLKMSEGTSMFRTNIEWLKFLVDFVELNNQFHLIIRIHPRMLPNKREGKTSAAINQLEEFFSQIPLSVTVNRPSEGISIYDLAKIVDVVVNGTSTVGLELLSFGIPVVNHCPEILFSYPAEFNYIGTTHQDYGDAIKQAAIDGRSISNSINAFRFRSFLFKQYSISLHDGVPKRTSLSAIRIVTWLTLRKNFVFLVGLLSALQRKELRRVPGKLNESPKLVHAVEQSSFDAEYFDGGLGLSENEEKNLIEQNLRKLQMW
jgi:hypothetical protein